MRLLFINQYYWPDLAATAQQLTDLAEHLAGAGHDVHVLCSQGLYDAQPGVTPAREEQRERVRIHRLRPWGSRRAGVAARLAAYAGFDLGCLTWLLRRGWRYDVVVTLTEPPLIGLFGVLLRGLSLGRVRHVCWCMDLYTDCLFALGSMKPRRPLGWLIERLNRLELRRADATVVLGECMRRRALAKGVHPSTLEVIGVWNRADQLEPVPRNDNSLRREQDLRDQVVVMYSGNAGRSHDFEAICEAMRRLRDREDICFLFVGGGKRLADIERFAEEHGLTNFTRRPYYPRAQLGESLSMGDVHLVSLHPSMSGVVVPCKLYGILAVGRPVIFVGPPDSTIAHEIRDAGAGVALTGTQTDELVEAIETLAADPAGREAMGSRGRSFFLEHHEKDVCCRHWESLLERVTADRARDDAAAKASGTKRQPFRASEG